MIETLGYIGGILLGLCALPEVYRTIKDKKCYVGSGFLWMWYMGEILLFIYVLPKKDLPLIGNYCFNIALISVMMYYKYRDKVMGRR